MSGMRACALITATLTAAIPMRQIMAENPVVKYRLADDGLTITVDGGAKAPDRIGRTDHRSSFGYVKPDQVFNRGQKRGFTMVVSGDKPRVALMRVFHLDALDPFLIQCGEARIRVTSGDKSAWLHDFPEMTAAFRPEGTSWRLASPQTFPGLECDVSVTCAEDWGLVLNVSVTNRAAAESNVGLEFHYGGIARHGRTSTASYFAPDSANLSQNAMTNEESVALASTKEFNECAGATTVPAVRPAIEGPRAVFRHRVVIRPGEKSSVSLVAARAWGMDDVRARLKTPDADALMREARSYYAGVLKNIAISTPSPTLNAAFLWGIANLDYVYDDPAWLEGAHWWSAYWCNNYQLSAALSVGQTDRVKKALRFLGLREWGPCPNLCASGKPADKYFEVGTPYFVHQFLQYVHHTGDGEFFREAAPRVDQGLDYLLKARGGREDGLISWMRGCNTFLYQADHLGLPGAGSSPSLMVSGLAVGFAEELKKRGMNDMAGRWSQIGRRMQDSALTALWDQRQGCFLSHRDPQGVPHPAHYYTDLVFPTLYTDLPEIFGWQSLDHLKRTLLLPHPLAKPDRPLLLMRVGELKPSLFGNDNVMPVQMAEAARAFCRIGDHNTAHALIEAVALGSILQTEAPGNFPERMGMDGKGEANYIFGNPIGSFVYSVVDGLFGLALADGGATARWQPAFPDAWDRATMTLPYARVNFSRRREPDGTIADSYRISHAGSSRALSFRVFLQPCSRLEAKVNGRPVKPALSPALSRTRVDFAAAAEGEKEHFVELRYSPAPQRVEAQGIVHQGQEIVCSFSSPLKSVDDPQKVLSIASIDASRLRGSIAGTPGPAVIYARMDAPPCVIPVSFDVRPRLVVACERADADPDGKAVALKLRLEGWAPEAGECGVTLAGATAGIPVSAWQGFGGTNLQTTISIGAACEGVYRLDWRMGSMKGRTDVVVGNADKGKRERLIQLRRERTHSLDMAAQKNASAIHQFFPWTDNDNGVDLRGLPLRDGFAHFDAMSFKIDTTNKPMALATMGISDPATWKIKPGLVCPEVTVQVGRRAAMLGLYYVTESDCRHTDTAVGSLRLRYKSGEDEVQPLIVGRQLAWIARPDACTEAAPVQGGLVWRTTCDPSRELASFTIRVDVPDAQIGLMAASIVGAR